MRGIFLDFLAQLIYHHTEVFCFLGVIRSPDGLQQPLMGKRLSFVNYESAQDVKFFGSQVDSLTTNVHDSSLEIDTQFRGIDFRKRFFGTETSQRGSNARQQFSHRKGFYDVIVRARIQCDNLVLFGVADRDHDNRALKGQSNLGASLEPAHDRHVYIQENQIRFLPNDRLDGFLAILRLDYVIAIAGERGSQDPTDLRLVVDHENGLVVHRFGGFHTGTQTAREQSIPRSKVAALGKNPT